MAVLKQSQIWHAFMSKTVRLIVSWSIHSVPLKCTTDISKLWLSAWTPRNFGSRTGICLGVASQKLFDCRRPLHIWRLQIPSSEPFSNLWVNELYDWLRSRQVHSMLYRIKFPYFSKLEVEVDWSLTVFVMRSIWVRCTWSSLMSYN